MRCTLHRAGIGCERVESASCLDAGRDDDGEDTVEAVVEERQEEEQKVPEEFACAREPVGCAPRHPVGSPV